MAKAKKSAAARSAKKPPATKGSKKNLAMGPPMMGQNALNQMPHMPRRRRKRGAAE